MKIGYMFLGGWSGPDTIVQTVLVLSQLLTLKVAQNKPLLMVLARLRPCPLRVLAGEGGAALAEGGLCIKAETVAVQVLEFRTVPCLRSLSQSAAASLG